MAYVISNDCICCGSCEGECPVGAISEGDGKFEINADECLDCGSCGAPTCKALAEDIVRGNASERDCVYYLRENLHKLSGEISGLADDLEENRGGKETLNLIKEYLQRISDEMSLLDKKEDEKDDRTGIGE